MNLELSVFAADVDVDRTMHLAAAQADYRQLKGSSPIPFGIDRSVIIRIGLKVPLFPLEYRGNLGKRRRRRESAQHPRKVIAILVQLAEDKITLAKIEIWRLRHHRLPVLNVVITMHIPSVSSDGSTPSRLHQTTSTRHDRKLRRCPAGHRR